MILCVGGDLAAELAARVVAPAKNLGVCGNAAGVFEARADRHEEEAAGDSERLGGAGRRPVSELASGVIAPTGCHASWVDRAGMAGTSTQNFEAGNGKTLPDCDRVTPLLEHGKNFYDADGFPIGFFISFEQANDLQAEIQQGPTGMTGEK